MSKIMQFFMSTKSREPPSQAREIIVSRFFFKIADHQTSALAHFNDSMAIELGLFRI
jgi:hypothetical protein